MKTAYTIATVMVGFSLSQIVMKAYQGNLLGMSFWICVGIVGCWIRTLK